MHFLFEYFYHPYILGPSLSYLASINLTRAGNKSSAPPLPFSTIFGPFSPIMLRGYPFSRTCNMYISKI